MRASSLLLRRLVPAGALLAVAATPALAQTTAPFTVVARNLDNPRHLAVGADGRSIFVAEAGRAGARCMGEGMQETCIGLTSRVLRIRDTGVRRVVGGMVSAGGRDGTFTTGIDGVSVDEAGTLYMVETGAGCGPVPPVVPARLQGTIGSVLVRTRSLRPAVVARISPVECRVNPDGTDRNPNPYGILALGRRRALVADAGANVIWLTEGSKVTVFAKIPRNGRAQSVPTSIARGPDGNVYVGELAEGAGTGKARVLRITPDGVVSVHATGFTAITGLAFGPDGSYYVTELTTDTRRRTAPGAVIKVAPDGTRTELGGGRLMFPAGAAVTADGSLYVSNHSVLPGRPAPAGPFAGMTGQVVRIPTTR